MGSPAGNRPPPGMVQRTSQYRGRVDGEPYRRPRAESVRRRSRPRRFPEVPDFARCAFPSERNPRPLARIAPARNRSPAGAARPPLRSLPRRTARAASPSPPRRVTRCYRSPRRFPGAGGRSGSPAAGAVSGGCSGWRGAIPPPANPAAAVGRALRRSPAVPGRRVAAGRGGAPARSWGGWGRFSPFGSDALSEPSGWLSPGSDGLPGRESPPAGDGAANKPVQRKSGWGALPPTASGERTEEEPPAPVPGGSRFRPVRVPVREKSAPARPNRPGSQPLPGGRGPPPAPVPASPDRPRRFAVAAAPCYPVLPVAAAVSGRGRAVGITGGGGGFRRVLRLAGRDSAAREPRRRRRAGSPAISRRSRSAGSSGQGRGSGAILGRLGPVLAVRFGCSLRTVRAALAGK